MAVREGIIKHTKLKIDGKLVKYEKKELDDRILRMDLEHSFTLEGQVVAIADEIAQITHDIDDGIRGGIIKFADFTECELVKTYLASEKINLNNTTLTYDQKSHLIKSCIGFLIKDVIDSSRTKIENYYRNYGEPKFKTVNDVYEQQCVSFSDKIKPQAEALEKSKTSWIICSAEISQSDAKAEYMIKQIFKAYYKHPKQLPDYILARYQKTPCDKLIRINLDDEKLQNDRFFVRLICDHIAGMTDQFAAREYMRLYQPEYY